MRSHPLLDQIARAGVRLGLDRVRELLRAMGEPHRAYPVVHIAGTNGKGSVSTYVTEALVAAGYRTGTTLSPHVEQVNERFLLDGKLVDDGTLTAVFEAIDRERADWSLRHRQTEGVPLTYFEFVTCAAFLLFADRRVDVAVAEVGLGGRLDATNVVSPAVTAVTHIGLDHTEVLGGTLAEIAAEKAGIFKRGVPVVVGQVPAEAREVLEQRARGLGCPCWLPGRHLARERRRGAWSFSTPEGQLTDVRLGMEGVHQGANAMVAVGVLHALRRQGFLIPDEAIRAGLERARLPGRLERLSDRVVADGAHNADGVRALAAWLADQPRPESGRVLLWGMSDGHAIESILPLLPHVDEVVTTRCAHPRAVDPLALAQAIQALDPDVLLAAGESIEQTLPELLEEDAEIVVAGSLFVAGAARSLLRNP